MLKPAHILTRTLLFFALFGLAYFLTDLATWGFTVTRLRTSQPLGPSEGVDPYLYLQQKFYLKDQGGQSFVFISADGKYILKFFKDMPRPWVPFSGYQKKKLGKLKRTLTGYHLAFDRLRQETGLLYLHLSPTQAPLPTVLVDRLAIEHAIDLSSIYFILQKRATPLTDFSETTLSQISELLQKRASAHIADHDPRLHSNLGWIEDHPVFIDPGRFVEDMNASSDFPIKFLEYLP
jgi:hypothetical protein